MNISEYNNGIGTLVKDIEHKFELLTPEEATKWLQHNPKFNRTPKRGNIVYLSDELRSMQWVLSPDAVVFSRKGKLLNGQHRLQAVIESGVPAWVAVWRNYPDEWFDRIDTGRGRSPADVLETSGEQYPAMLSSAVALASRMLGGTYMTDNRRISPRTIKMLVEQEHPKIRESIGFVETVIRTPNALTNIPKSTVGGLHYLFTQVDKEKADRFVQDLAFGAELVSGDAMLLLRALLANNKTSKRKLSPKYLVALTIKTWNARMRGDSPKLLRFSAGAGEEFPLIDGLKYPDSGKSEAVVNS